MPEPGPGAPRRCHHAPGGGGNETRFREQAARLRPQRALGYRAYGAGASCCLPDPSSLTSNSSKSLP